MRGRAYPTKHSGSLWDFPVHFSDLSSGIGKASSRGSHRRRFECTPPLKWHTQLGVPGLRSCSVFGLCQHNRAAGTSRKCSPTVKTRHCLWLNQRRKSRSCLDWGRCWLRQSPRPLCLPRTQRPAPSLHHRCSFRHRSASLPDGD